MEVVTDGASDGVTPKNTSTTRRFLAVFVFVVTVYAAATTLGSGARDGKDGDQPNLAIYHEVTMRDLLQTESTRRALRRELQSEETPPPSALQLDETPSPSALQSGATPSPSAFQLDATPSPSEVQSEATPSPVTEGADNVVATNGTRRFLQVGNNRTRYLQANGTAGRVLQANRTRYLQANGTGTGRVLHDVDVPLELLYPETIDLKLPSPCRRVDVGMPNSPEWRTRCQKYLNEVYTMKKCEGSPEKVPRIYHSVSHYSDQTYHQQATSAQNPSFLRNHLSDDEAADFVKNFCGEEAHQAYRCFAPPAYRADLFRFCALYSQGGIYLDEDIFPFVPLQELYSPCATATVGHDFPWMDKKGKQMKILASAPGAPIFQCALRTIIENVRARAYPESELELTGPQMLQKCYEDHHDDVAVTYHDTRNAEWPFTGMRRGQKILAYEIPMSSKHFWREGGKDKEDYTDLFNRRLVYKDTCELQ